MGLIARRAEKYKSVDGYLKELWRPLMAWNYAIIVLFDFMLGPILLGIYSVATHQPYIQWQPLTIQGGGMFHIAMGAVIGVSAWSRGQEKISGTDTGGMPEMPGSWDTNAKTGPLIPQYVPPQTNQFNTGQFPQPIQNTPPQFNQMPANPGVNPGYSEPVYTPTPQPVAQPAPQPYVQPQINISVDTTPDTPVKSKSGFPKAKRF
jgi:hypothetical protein